MNKKINISPISFSLLLKCEIVRIPNQHIRATVYGYIHTLEDVLYRNWNKESITIDEIDENGKRTLLFCGMMDIIAVEEEGDLNKLSFEAVSYTELLDLKKQIRVFQNDKQTFEAVVDYIAKKSENALYIFTENKDKLTNGLIMQYQETDWNFLIRIASYMNTVIVPDCTNDRSCYYFGLPKRHDTVSLVASHYRIQRNMADLEEKKKSGLPSLGMQDATDYIVKSEILIELCAPVEFQGKRLRVAEAVSKWENGELLHEYRLKSDEGFKTIPFYNPLISGLSMRGKVKAVKEDKVKVEFEDTDGGIEDNSKWFDFATVYSSERSVGWYCMPENGDQLRIYFPNVYENHAFALSAVHLEKQRGWELLPEEKFIRTVDDKEIRLTPEKIEITNHKGMSIVINDNTGIEITSDKEILMNSTEGINLNSGEEILIAGKSGVFLKQSRNTIAVCNGILEKASKVEHR